MNMCIYIDIIENNYTKNIYYFEVSNKMTFYNFKELITKRVNIVLFNILFIAMYLDSEDKKLNNKPLDFFLFKNESTIKLIPKNNYNIQTKVSSLTINNEYKKGHYIAYKINKPVIIDNDLKNVNIITPNGFIHKGPLCEILDKLYRLGYKYNSCATNTEIDTIKYLNDSYYLF